MQCLNSCTASLSISKLLESLWSHSVQVAGRRGCEPLSTCTPRGMESSLGSAIDTRDSPAPTGRTTRSLFREGKIVIDSDSVSD